MTPWSQWSSSLEWFTLAVVIHIVWSQLTFSCLFSQSVWFSWSYHSGQPQCGDCFAQCFPQCGNSGQPHPSLSWPVINQIDQQCHHYLIKHVSPAFNVSSSSPAVCSWFFRDFCTKQRKSSFHQTGSPDLPLSLSCSTKHSKTSNTQHYHSRHLFMQWNWTLAMSINLNIVVILSCDKSGSPVITLARQHYPSRHLFIQ